MGVGSSASLRGWAGPDMGVMSVAGLLEERLVGWR